MSDALEYRGYASTVEFSAEDRCFHGKIAGIRDLVAYDGTTVDELEKNFRSAVDEYLAFCKEEGKTPDKPFKGSLNIRIPSDLHRALAIRAEQQHKSLNSVIAEQLASTVGMLGPVGTIVARGALASTSVADKRSKLTRSHSITREGKAAGKSGGSHRKAG
jgi:predicted HicB family RNase H-like nuclease